MLGGVTISGHAGLAGHSDADVVAHAVADALLGAAGMGDIGLLFPSDDPAYAGADSLMLLAEVTRRVRTADLVVENVDVVVVCETPSLAPYKNEMAQNLARALGVAATQVSVKATTTEGMGFTGRREGIAVTAVCLLSPADSKA